MGHGRVPIPPPNEIAQLPRDGGERFNRLVFEQSPYLLQHAANPVDWYPWSDEAFAKARAEDKPIFLSIGYSTCHWCHVMEHESFEDSTVASLMNEGFVCIKVDREERPDVDQLYMAATQAITGRGGWPMTVLLTPDRVPFFAGTYFPKAGRGGRPGMLDLLPQVTAGWKNDRQKVLGSAEQIRGFLEQQMTPKPGDAPGFGLLAECYRQLASRYEPQYGGFANSPKFPTPHNFRFLLRHWDRAGEEKALEMVTHTLDAMRSGGIWDHLGYGFHRYSTDERWLVPHFEKMLYDQALVALAYLEAFQATGDPTYAETVHQIFAYVERDLTAPEGAFYSAEDADSEGAEGKFYIWRPAETIAVLGDEEGTLWNRVFDITATGNFHDPHSGITASIPHLERSLASWSAELDIPENQLSTRLEASRIRLLTERSKRIRPFRDDKVLTDWNGLMIAALAVGAQVLAEPKYAAAAQRAADFSLRELRDDRGRLLKRWRLGQAGLPGTLEDYAFLSWGLLELYEATFEVRYLQEAETLTRNLLELFVDEESGGFFLASAGQTDLLFRPKEGYDGAIPSGNSVAALVLLRLGRILGDPSLETQADRVLAAFGGGMKSSPMGYTQMLLALDYLAGPSYEVVIAGRRTGDDTNEMLRALRRPFLPRKVVILREPGADGKEIVELAPYAATQLSVDGRATAYVCQNYACQQPTTDPKVMLAALAPTNSVK